MQLVYYPDPRLREVCIEAPKQPEKERARIAVKMWKIMRKRRGVGLAAPQVGLNIRMFAFMYYGENRIIWNPVLSFTRGREKAIEGCLSLLKVTIEIQRATSSTLTGQGVDGLHLDYFGDNRLTRIWQHEIDHLDGKLIIDHMSLDETIFNKDALSILTKVGETG